MEKIILGMYPGRTYLGWTIIKNNQRRVTLLDAGNFRINDSTEVNNDSKILLFVKRQLTDIIAATPPHAIVHLWHREYDYALTITKVVGIIEVTAATFGIPSLLASHAQMASDLIGRHNAMLGELREHAKKTLRIPIKHDQTANAAAVALWASKESNFEKYIAPHA